LVSGLHVATAAPPPANRVKWETIFEYDNLDKMGNERNSYHGKNNKGIQTKKLNKK
jgi:hypothetical protein